MRLAELIKYNKYKNNNNLIKASNFYFDINKNEFSLMNDVEDDGAATIALIVVQFTLNSFLIQDICVQYVFNLRDEKLLRRLEKIAFYKNTLMEKYKIDNSYLSFPCDEIANRYISFLKNWKGYRTYGDFELLLSHYLAPFFKYTEFNQCLDLIRYKVDEPPRKGLTQFLRKKYKPHLTKLEKQFSLRG